MSKDKVLILTHPHSGSSLLKTMMESCDNTIVVDGESPKVWKAIGGLVNIAKYPMYSPTFDLSKVSGDHEIVILVRDPRYALKSLTERFKDKEIPEDHKEFFLLGYWQWYLSSYLACGYHKLRYRDIFDSQKLESLFHTLGLKWSHDLYGDYERKLVKNTIVPQDKPDPTDHMNYREWQLSQPIFNKNPKKFENGEGIYKQITELSSYQKIFGG